MSTPETVICQYRVKPGKEAAFEKLLAAHRPALEAAGLVTDARTQLFRSKRSAKYDPPPEGTPKTYVEIFEWKSAEAASSAHSSPEVMAVWGPMAELCEDMKFPHYEPIAPGD